MSKSTEKIVYIRRKPEKRFDRNSALKQMNLNAFKYLGAAGETPITGLTEVEKHFILPELLGISPAHVEFGMRANNFYHELSELVPAGRGLRLNVTTNKVKKDYDGGKVEVEIPVKPRDYVIYKRAIAENYRACADTLEEAKAKGEVCKFYVYDPEVESKIEADLGDNRDDAYDAYLTLVNKHPEKWESILIIYGEDPDTLSKIDQKKKLRSLAQAEGIVGVDEQIKRFKEFVDLVDSDIETKAKLKKFLSKGLLIVQGTSYIYDNGASSVTLGKNEAEAIAWLKNPDNSKDVLIMTAKAGQ